jgi:exosome complex RNA-binding protein Rrp4
MNRLSVVYTRVVHAESWIQTELSCQSIDRSKKKSDFGLIDDGNILRCSLALCEKLQRSQLINRFNQMLSNFKIRVARNGFIWYITDTLNVMIAVKNVLAEHESEDNIEYLINRYHVFMDKLQKQDDSLVKAKQQQQQQQQPTEKKETEIKKIPQIMNINSNNNAVSRLLNQVIKSVLDSIIDDIEKNEKK